MTTGTRYSRRVRAILRHRADDVSGDAGAARKPIVAGYSAATMVDLCGLPRLVAAIGQLRRRQPE